MKIQKLYDRARELYPNWNPYIGAKSVEGVIEIGQFAGVFEELLNSDPVKEHMKIPEVKLVPIEYAEAQVYDDAEYHNKLKRVILGPGFRVKGDKLRIHSMMFGSFFYKPNMVQPPTGAYFLPEIVSESNFKPSRGILLSFDRNALIDSKHGATIVPEGKLAGQIHMDKKAWKTMVRTKYFSNINDKIDQMLESIYNLQMTPQPDAELLGKIMIRVHEDDIYQEPHSEGYYTTHPQKIEK